MSDSPKTKPLLEDLLNPEHLSQELGVSLRTIHRWHQQRMGPPRIVIGRKPYYRRDAVKSWLIAQEKAQVRSCKAVA
jgi:DNA-binding transcriptional MerR regulator